MRRSGGVRPGAEKGRESEMSEAVAVVAAVVAVGKEAW